MKYSLYVVKEKNNNKDFFGKINKKISEKLVERIGDNKKAYLDIMDQSMYVVCSEIAEEMRLGFDYFDNERHNIVFFDPWLDRESVIKAIMEE